ncbi:MAG: FG-GAP-like repeat-containing protein [Isosphaeraceae bacterium]
MKAQAWLGLAAALVALALGGVWGFRQWRASTLLESAKAAMDRGEHRAAADRFAAVLGIWPDHDEAEFGLAVSEAAAGRADATLDAWGRISRQSPYAPIAAVRVAPLLLDRGRYAQAEEALRLALRRPGTGAKEAYELLGRVLRFEDRRDEARELLRQELRTADDPVRVLRGLWLLDFEAVAVDRTRALLDRAARDAPEDDRVRLGLANLDRRSGRLDDARRGLLDCLAARPDDEAVWRSWLDWALAADRQDEVVRALGRLPARRFSEGEIQGLRAWLARRLGDASAERRALEAQVQSDPAAPGALERLAELASLAGKTEEAAALRRQKAELDDVRERYHRLFQDEAARLSTHAEELAKLAETLGRPIEARGWWRVRLRTHPNDDRARDALTRLNQDRETPPAPSVKAVERVADLVPPPTTPRPLETPGDDAPTRAHFRDVAERAGLRFQFDQDRSPDRQLPETMSGGVGLIDFDRDGWLDVYCVQGGPLVPGQGRTSTGDRLFRNKGNGTFEDVSERSGIAAMARGYGHGLAVGDLDGDGWPDLFITRFGSYALYRNRGDGTFEDVTEASGLSGERGWPTSAALADLDDDGDLDLYVCQYLRWDRANPTRCHDPETGEPTYCEPRAFEAEPDRLFRNDGGRFVDVTEAAGIVDRDGRGLGVVAADLDGDGLLDLFVANDTTANLAFFNQGGLTFREGGLEAGLAANASSGFLAGMGVAAGDLDGDGRPDLAVTNFYDESTTFYRNLGGGFFADRGAAIGLALPSRYLLGFGVSFLDYDDDGRLDLVTANGHVNDSRPLYPYAMPMQLLAGDAQGRLRDVTALAGPPLTTPRLGRGLAVGDLDNDGKVDLLVVSQGEPLAYLHNETSGGRSLTLQLEGTASGRDAVGARVVVTAGGRTQTAWRFGGGSYLSASDPRIRFGLGEAREIDSVEVTWPSGRVDRVPGLKPGAGYSLREGQPQPETLPGFDGGSTAR